MAQNEVTNRIKEMEEETRICEPKKYKVSLMTIAYAL